MAARKITVKITAENYLATVVSPKGGARRIDLGALYGAGPGTDERRLFNTLEWAVRTGNDAELTIEQMRFLAAVGTEVAAPLPRTRQMEKIVAGTMEPLIDGDWRETNVEKYAYQCTGCGLVWSREWHADTCRDRGHVSEWQQRYTSGPVVNGRPTHERFYPRIALRREAVA